MKKIFVAAFVLTSLAALLVANIASVKAQSGNSWLAKADMPTARAGFGVAVVNGNLYAIGGYNMNQTTVLTVNEMYNPTADAWTEKAPMPTHRVSFAIAVFEEKIYIFGGQVIVEAGARIMTNVTEVYDTASDTWATKTPMPLAQEDFVANEVEGKIYVIGTHTDVYDPTTDSWTTKTPIPVAVAHTASAVVDDKIYIISGNYYGTNPSFFDPVKLNQIYDPKTDKWSSGASIPTGVASPAAAATTGISAPKAIYVVGGLIITNNTSGGFIFNTQDIVQIYFPENNSWSMGASMPTGRYALCAAELDDKIYAMGGSFSIGSPDLTSNEQYLPLGYGTAANQEIIYGIAVAIVATVTIAATVLVLGKRHKGKLNSSI